jgi:hypothetical protein
MSLRLIVPIVAVLAVAAPAFAQTAPISAPAPAPAASAVAGPDEDAVEAASAAFEAQIEQMTTEIQSAKAAAGTDTAKANADADTIVAKYQPKADAFAEMVKAFIATQPVAAEEQGAVIAALDQIRSIPKMARDHVMNPEPASAAPAAPAATPPSAN